MDFRSVMAATCISSAIATLLMAFLANYPIALAPGMGLNAFFSFTVCGAMGVPWQIALGIVFISGVVFTILTVVRVREMIITAIPNTLKLATAAGIGHWPYGIWKSSNARRRNGEGFRNSRGLFLKSWLRSVAVSA